MRQPIDNFIGELYLELEPSLSRIIDDEAIAFHRALNIGLDDARQEIRLALMLGLPHYDYNLSRGGILAYSRKIAHHAMCELLSKAMTRSRAPQVVVEGRDGERRLVRYHVGSLSELEEHEEPADNEETGAACWSATPYLDPERSYLISERNERIEMLRVRLIGSLSGRALDVFMCQSAPSDEFILFMRNIGASEATILVIAQWLGLTKNEVDWALHQIRRVYTEVLETSDFIDFIRGALRGKRWPMIYHSPKADDAEFISKILEERDLNPKPSTPRSVVLADGGSMSIETYEWGAIIHAKLDLVSCDEDGTPTIVQEEATLVTEGRFNRITGEVIGPAGHWKQVSEVIPWYPVLLKRIRRKRRNGP